MNNGVRGLLIFVVIFAIVICCFVAVAIRADSTFVPIEKPTPTVCQKACPVCGGCVPMLISVESGLPARAAIHEWRCQNFDTLYKYSDPWGDLGETRFTTISCDSIIWGRYRTICRIDTVPPDQEWYYADHGIRNYTHKPILDTIYVDDKRCDTIPTVRARGLDSVYTLPHDSCVCNKFSGRYSSYGTPIYVDTTFHVEGHWTYYNWSNGKRVNMRKVK